MKTVLWRLLAASCAAVYWLLVSWTCFAVTGLDLLDAVSTGAATARRIEVAIVLSAGIVGFAWAGRAMWRRTGAGFPHG